MILKAKKEKPNVAEPLWFLRGLSKKRMQMHAPFENLVDIWLELLKLFHNQNIQQNFELWKQIYEYMKKEEQRTWFIRFV